MTASEKKIAENNRWYHLNYKYKANMSVSAPFHSWKECDKKMPPRGNASDVYLKTITMRPTSKMDGEHHFDRISNKDQRWTPLMIRYIS